MHLANCPQWKDRGTKKELITCSTERGPDLTIPKLKLDTQLTETVCALLSQPALTYIADLL